MNKLIYLSIFLSLQILKEKKNNNILNFRIFFLESKENNADDEKMLG